MHRHLVLLTLTLGVAGCGGGGFEVPDFVGRDGSGEAVYVIGGEDSPLPVAVTPRSVTLEPALHGALVRVEAVAPTQGYHSPQLLVANNGRPDAAGLLRLEFVAVPPLAAADVGPERTRQLRAAHFVPVRAFRNVNGVQIAGAGTLQTLTLPK